MERNVLEYVDHLHEHFVYPVSINSQGRYNVPQNSEEGYSIRVSGKSCYNVLLSVYARMRVLLLNLAVLTDARRCYQGVRIPKW